MEEDWGQGGGGKEQLLHSLSSFFIPSFLSCYLTQFMLSFLMETFTSLVCHQPLLSLTSESFLPSILFPTFRESYSCSAVSYRALQCERPGDHLI